MTKSTQPNQKLEKATELYFESITQCHLFSGLLKEEVDDSLRLLDARFSTYSKNKYLHHADEAFDYFGLVLYGRVKVMIDDIEGNSAIMAEVTPGNTFAESLCFMNRHDSNVYICASEASGVLWLSSKLLFVGNQDSLITKIEKRFAEMLASRTLAMNDRIQILSKLTLRDKIVAFLTFSRRDAKSNSIDIPLSREEMAVYFGTNRSALSRELSKMKADGLIDYSRNRFTILF